MTLATLRISFSRPESEIICSYLASAGIPAIPAERHHATCNGDYLVAQGGIHIKVPKALLADAHAALAEAEASPQLSESRAFARHYVANALIFLCAFTSLGMVYFPYWVRTQRESEISDRVLS
jgi:hypothetical protein